MGGLTSVPGNPSEGGVASHLAIPAKEAWPLTCNLSHAGANRVRVKERSLNH